MTRLTLSSIATAILLAFASSSAFAETACSIGEAPIIPDGNVASEDELVAAQKAYKEFDANTMAYRECLLEEKALIEASGADSEEMTAKLQANLDADNAAYDKLVNVAEEFNQAVRAFKAR